MINENSNEENSISEVEKNIEAGRSLNPSNVAKAILGFGSVKSGSKNEKELNNIKVTIGRLLDKHFTGEYFLGSYKHKYSAKYKKKEEEKKESIKNKKEQLSQDSEYLAEKEHILRLLLENKELIHAFFKNPTNRMSKGYGGKQKREDSEGLMSFLTRVINDQVSKEEEEKIIMEFNHYQQNKPRKQSKTKKLDQKELSENQQPTSEKIEINKDIENEFEEKIEEKQRKSSLNLDVFLGDLCLPEFYLPEKEEEKKERKGSDLFNKLSGEGFDPFKPF